MARSIQQIRAFLISTLVSNAASIGITINPNNWSKADYKNLILDTIATGQGIEEQLWDAYTTDINNTISVAAPETDAWIQDQIINKFQFNSDTPQVVGIFPPNFNPVYPIENDSYKIIKYCSSLPGVFGTTLIKVAAQVNGAPADVDTIYGVGTLDTVRAFIKAITNPGITKIVTSGDADRLWLQLDVYFDGTYAAVIQTNVIAAINAFLTALPFNGAFIVSDLEYAIKSVIGVIDCIFINARGRANNVAFPGGIDLNVNSTVINRLYNTTAGYIILEDTVGNLITDPRPTTPTINNLNLIPA